MTAAIQIRDLGKTYRVAHTEAATTMASALASRLRHPLRRRTAYEQFEALKGLNLDVPAGQVIGIIGRNGAGKSTLLKILSRITEPTTGEARIRGRLGSLLEIGTGFHPELTGRENVYLNGALLGMGTREVTAKFDEIVAFAGVERFLDTPVKRYSSGMYVRLGFSVAAHLDTNVLVVDEVLAVGDSEFQQRCLGRMREMSTSGRTVIFVSHQLQAVTSLCDRVVWLSGGQLVGDGSPDVVIQDYLESFRSNGEMGDADERPGTGELRVDAVGLPNAAISPGEPLVLELTISQHKPHSGPCFVSIGIVDELGNQLTHVDSRMVELWVDGPTDLQLAVHSPWLKPGRYHVDVAIARLGPLVDVWAQAAVLDVLPSLPYPGAVPTDALTYGLVLPSFELRRV